ncbi:general secretion pathway protein GspE, partial [Myxococcota bacterium]|nr:general secretion pathway protein GspE [Myxococcota bacterium]
MAARIKLGELLVRAGVLDEFKLKAALSEQQRWGGRLGKLLVEMGFVSEDLLVKALSKQLGIPRAKLEAAYVPGEILARIDASFATNNALCPERYVPEKKTLYVAMADPTNVGAIDELRFKTGVRIETTLAGELEISQAIDRLFFGRGPIEGLDLASSPFERNAHPGADARGQAPTFGGYDEVGTLPSPAQPPPPPPPTPVGTPMPALPGAPL